MSEGKKVLILVYADENIQYRHGQMARYHTAAAVAKLHTNQDFLAAMTAAGEEIDRVRKKGLPPSGDCAAEAEVLSTRL